MEDVANRLTSTAQPRVIAALCAECQTQVRATHKPDFCGACGVIDGPWVLMAMAHEMRGGRIRVAMRARLAGVWSAAARAQAVVDLGDMLEGG
mgnify:CR=1 FL=1